MPTWLSYYIYRYNPNSTLNDLPSDLVFEAPAAMAVDNLGNMTVQCPSLPDGQIQFPAWLSTFQNWEAFRASTSATLDVADFTAYNTPSLEVMILLVGLKYVINLACPYLGGIISPKSCRILLTLSVLSFPIPELYFMMDSHDNLQPNNSAAQDLALVGQIQPTGGVGFSPNTGTIPLTFELNTARTYPRFTPRCVIPPIPCSCHACRMHDRCSMSHDASINCTCTIFFLG